MTRKERILELTFRNGALAEVSGEPSSIPTHSCGVRNPRVGHEDPDATDTAQLWVKDVVSLPI